MFPCVIELLVIFTLFRESLHMFWQIVTNVFVQFVILLYLLDNNAETSWMILMGQGVGMLIEAWKVTKAVDIQLVPSQPGSLLPYRLSIQGMLPA